VRKKYPSDIIRSVQSDALEGGFISGNETTYARDEYTLACLVLRNEGLCLELCRRVVHGFHSSAQTTRRKGERYECRPQGMLYAEVA